MTNARLSYRWIAVVTACFSVSFWLSLPLFAQSFDTKMRLDARTQVDSAANATSSGPEARLTADAGLGAPLNIRPSLANASPGSTQHPRVFMTPAYLSDLVKRINSPDSYSARNFSKLATQVGDDLKANVDWDATYSGCDLDIYLHAFSYEPPGGYANERRSSSQMAEALNVKSGLSAPAGAAIVASRLALYAALVKGGVRVSSGSPEPEPAAALSRRILLAWASRGFRVDGREIVQSPAKFCESNGTVTHGSEAAVGLQIGRGIVYSVDAQDLLQSIDALNAKDGSELNGFHDAIFELIRNASNFRATLPEMNGPDSACELYSNHVGAHLIALLSIARLLDDSRKFNAVVHGNESSIPLAIPWTKYFDHAVYGENDRPIACHKNKGSDSLSSHPFFQTAVVAPGEILDRYRNANESQAFGYTLGVLAGLYTMADVMKNGGFDAFAYRGPHHQSIELATDYYACYGRYVGFKKAVDANNARACPDYQQYIGQIVNGLETAIVMGAYYFPQDITITQLEEPAKAELLKDPLDTTHFGRWRD